MNDRSEIVSVRYMVDDVEKAVAFYTKLLDFEVLGELLTGRRLRRIGRVLPEEEGPVALALAPAGGCARPGCIVGLETPNAH